MSSIGIGVGVTLCNGGNGGFFFEWETVLSLKFSFFHS